MNNNRGNNRRRGRGNNRQQGSGQQLNRIDSRARGNAPQMLEKYRKLAHDAHLNGDRVTEEYFLQFADHYFRVIADTRVRQDETRQRRDDRPQDGSDNGDRDSYRDDADDAGEYGIDDGPYAAYDQQLQQAQPRRDRDEQPRRDRDEQPRRDRGEQQSAAPRREREERPRRDDRERAAPAPAPQDTAPAAEPAEENGASDDGAPRSVYEPVENPFVRESRARGPRPRREGREERPRRASTRAVASDGADASGQSDAPAGLDPAALPPAISAVRSDDEPPVSVATPTEEGEAKPRRRTRKPRPPVDDAGETLESVS